MRKKFLFLFLLSGISGLIYEVLWMKLLSRVFGVSSFATGTVLSVFMLGLAIGSFFFGHMCKKSSPIKLFIGLEIGIALSALLVPWLLGHLGVFYNGFFEARLYSFTEISIYRFLGALLVLIVPTSLMGGTLPVAAKILYKKGKLGNDVASLYAINTFGAVMGAFFSAFFLIDRLGITYTNYVAVMLNTLIVFVAALPCGGKIHTNEVVLNVLSENKSKNFKVYVLLFATAVSGFVSLGLETIWTRVLSLIFQNTVYAFSTILSVFLLGIAFGSLFLKGWLSKRKRSWSIYGSFLICFGIFSLLLIPLFGQIFLLFKNMGGNELASGWFKVSVTKFLICLITMFLPTFCLGLAFPMGCKVLEGIIGEGKDKINVGSAVGMYSGFNTIGAVLGAFIVPFILVPHYGSQEAAIWLFYAITGVGVVIVFFEKESSWREKLLIFSVALGFIIGCTKTKNLFDIMFQRQALGGKYNLIFSMEDESGLTEVLSDKLKGIKRLVTNRQQQEGDNSPESIYSQKKQGYLPLLIKPNVKDIAVIGIGTGISLAPIPYFLPSRVDCLEISTGVIKAASMFEKENQDILFNPRINVIKEDGRNYLGKTKNSYDLIIADLFTPYRASVGNIYSLEHYQTCKEKLKSDGMMVQWLPPHQLSVHTLKIIARTFTEVFPHTTLWATKQSIALIGQNTPFHVDFDWMVSCMKKAHIAKDLDSVKLHDPYEFLASFLMGERELRRFCSGAYLNTDNKPIIEYISPKEFDASKSESAYYKILEQLISKKSQVPIKEYPANKGYRAPIAQKLRAYLESRFLLYKAKIARSKKQYAKSIAFYRKSWEIRKDEKEVMTFLENHYITRGNQVYKTGRIKDGINTLKEAITYSPKSVLARSNIATIYFVNHEYDKAAKWWKKVLEVEPGDADAKEGIKAAKRRNDFFAKQAAEEEEKRNKAGASRSGKGGEQKKVEHR